MNIWTKLAILIYLTLSYGVQLYMAFGVCCLFAQFI